MSKKKNTSQNVEMVISWVLQDDHFRCMFCLILRRSMLQDVHKMEIKYVRNNIKQEIEIVKEIRLSFKEGLSLRCFLISEV